MPISRTGNIGPILELVTEQYEPFPPESVLDVGCGWGMFGVLMRHAFDPFTGQQKETRILGIEPFEEYKNPLWEIYDCVLNRKFEDMPLDTLGMFDLVLCCDVLEHFENPFPIIDKLEEVANNMVIVSVPIGKMEQGVHFGNPLEEHKYEFNAEDLMHRGYKFTWVNDYLSRKEGIPGVVAWKILI